ncbi:neuropeptide-like protein C4orf48 homolog [Erpetoichthys calabaricus]|uniref:NELL2-interacting cell ontogeny regulator 1 n=1 Tax=Erpetoichthys calabaricus TaxID=27687 RepID=A0A8C4TC12_ERPCA|nr:neuropeptide-like protein C4orf48 homolog [Polypterus senegalus]XP_039607653.1 neuropeptide-like protein C4orf48 homolog [Polypterus senegalus]XP_051784367.1 neuropeptide-like protein C4orf48 homolog [Erpetoichthys calabaricus]
MALPPVSQPMLFLVLTVALMASIWVKPIRASSPEAGTVIPAESRPCVDCHAFEFMQRALQDLRKTAFNLDSRTETLLLGVEKRALCDCLPTNALS